MEKDQNSIPNKQSAWHTHRARLVGWFIKQGISTNDAEDLAQESLLKALKNHHQLKEDNKLAPWLFKIARNTAIDHYRRKGIPIDWLDQDTDVSEDLILSMEDCIRPFINLLPPDTQRILTEIHLNGLSQKSYAEQHGLNYSTVKSRLQKAREFLADQYRSCCIIQQDAKGNIQDIQEKAKGCQC